MNYSRTPLRQLKRLYDSIVSSAEALRNLPITLESANQSLLQQLALHAPRKSNFDIYDRQNLKLLLDMTSVLDRCMIETGSWEQPQTSFLIGHLKKLAEKTDVVFLDIGAYWGLYSLLAMRAGVRTIHCFEGDRHNFAQLQAQIFLNNATDVITAHNIAVSSEAGRLKFWDSRTHPHGNRGGVGIAVSIEPGMTSYEVDAVSIDKFLSISGKTVCIKLDVEGHEHVVLKGLRQTIANNRVLMQVEIFDQERARVMAVIESLGVRKIREIGPDNYFTNMTDEEI